MTRSFNAADLQNLIEGGCAKALRYVVERMVHQKDDSICSYLEQAAQYAGNNNRVDMIFVLADARTIFRDRVLSCGVEGLIQRLHVGALHYMAHDKGVVFSSDQLCRMALNAVVFSRRDLLDFAEQQGMVLDERDIGEETSVSSIFARRSIFLKAALGRSTDQNLAIFKFFHQERGMKLNLLYETSSYVLHGCQLDHFPYIAQNMLERMTVFMAAAMAGNGKVLDYCMAQAVDPTIMNNKGERAADLVPRNFDDLLQKLVAYESQWRANSVAR